MNTDKVMEIAVRRGILWQSNEIYGGTAGFWDLGPFGLSLKNKIVNTWRKYFVLQEGFFEIESPTIVPEIVFVASGHVKKFADPLVDCTKCGACHRADHLIEDATGRNVEGCSDAELKQHIVDNNIKCPDCSGALSDVRYFNLMFSTSIGASSENRAYARPETAQGMFVAFDRINQTMHPQLPFGIVQVGKAYRNEISPRQGLLRVREFDQMEAEIFVDDKEINNHPNFNSMKDEILRLFPADQQNRDDGKIIEMSAGDAVKDHIIDNEFLAYYLAIAKKFLLEIGIPLEHMRMRQQLPDEKAHYSRDTWDVEINTGTGWVEVAGHAYRGNYDLTNHIKTSGKDLSYFIPFDNPKTVMKEVAKVDKKAVGQQFGREAKNILAEIAKNEEGIVAAKKGNSSFKIQLNGEDVDLCSLIELGQKEEKLTGQRIVPHVVEPSYGVGRILWCVLEHSLKVEEDRTYLSIAPNVAPVDVAVFPLVNKEGMPDIAQKIKATLIEEGMSAAYENKGSIGRRYARNDEVGVPFAITVDSDTLKDDTVTLRHRDTKEQRRVKISDLVSEMKQLLK